MLLQTTKNKIALPPNPEDVILGSRGVSEAEGGAGVLSLPDDALICSCEAVQQGQVCSSVTEQDCESVMQ
jgi:nitrite reductase (NADH) large subunit